MASKKSSGRSKSDLEIDPRERAEDIILGGLGFDCEVRLLSVELSESGHYFGQAKDGDGELISFQSEEPASPLDRWAVATLQCRL